MTLEKYIGSELMKVLRKSLYHYIDIDRFDNLVEYALSPDNEL